MTKISKPQRVEFIVFNLMQRGTEHNVGRAANALPTPYAVWWFSEVAKLIALCYLPH